MTRSRMILLAFGMTVAPTPSFADVAVSEADQEACTSDVFRLCSDYIPNVAPIVACLKSKKVELSVPCREVMFRPVPKGARPYRFKGRHVEQRDVE